MARWMVENGPYRTKHQLPGEYIPELPIIGGWPAFDEFDFINLEGIKGFLNSKKQDIIKELDERNRMRHNVECLVRQGVKGGGKWHEEENAPDLTQLNFWKKIGINEGDCQPSISGDDTSPSASTVLCNLIEQIEKGWVKVQKMSIDEISPKTSIFAHFGESNSYLSIVMGVLPSSNDDGCLTIRVHGEERILASEGNDNFLLFDDSFMTEMVNVCEESVHFLRLDFVHPNLVMRDTVKKTLKKAEEPRGEEL
jgi:hypothetical protein